MPETSIAELSRSFPAPHGWNEDPLEPDLTAYGVFRDPKAALFVWHDQSHEKRVAVSVDRRIAGLLAYGPPGSHVLHICHADPSRELKDRRLCCVKGKGCLAGDKVAQSKILRDLLMQISLQLGELLSPDVSERLQLWGRRVSPQLMPTYAGDLNFTRIVATRLGVQSSEEISSYLSKQGFSPTSVDRMQKFAMLCGLSMEMKFQSRIQQLLGKSKVQISKAMVTLAADFEHDIHDKLNLNETIRWLLEEGLPEDQVFVAITTFPSFLSSNIQQGLKPVVQWLLDLGLTKAQIAKGVGSPGVLSCNIGCNLEPKVKWLKDLGLNEKQVREVIGTCPQVLGLSLEQDLSPTVCWLRNLGLSKAQVVHRITAYPQIFDPEFEKEAAQGLIDFGLGQAQLVKVMTRYPAIFGWDVEGKLNPYLQWLMDLGLSKSNIAKVVSGHPQILGYSIEENIKPKAQWLVDLGLSQSDVGKVISKCPQIFSYSLEKNLKPKLDWLLMLGCSKRQLAKIVYSFPALFGYSISANLRPKLLLLQKVFGAQGAAEVIARKPVVLGYNYQRLSTRMEVLKKQKEVSKLTRAMLMTEEQFHARFVKKFLSLGPGKFRSTNSGPSIGIKSAEHFVLRPKRFVMVCLLWASRLNTFVAMSCYIPVKTQ